MDVVIIFKTEFFFNNPSEFRNLKSYIFKISGPCQTCTIFPYVPAILYSGLDDLELFAEHGKKLVYLLDTPFFVYLDRHYMANILCYCLHTPYPGCQISLSS